MKCEACGTEFESKVCPECGKLGEFQNTTENVVSEPLSGKKVEPVKSKKPIFKKWWFWVLVIIVGISAISGLNNDSSTNPVTDDSSAVISSSPSSSSNASSITPTNTPIKSGPSAEFINALIKAETYASAMKMSKQAIYDQLVSEYGEKFPAAAAKYAINNLKFDWNANALAKAKTYQETMNMSKSAIYDQLISEFGEKFTKKQAQYAIDHL